MKELIPVEAIECKIFLIRGHKVMFDRDLAKLYGVENKQLLRQVRRNIERFPDDFMFKLTEDEAVNLRCQIGTSSWGGRRYLPLVFTQEGVAMLSGVLNSERAVKVNIQIMRAFVKLRQILSTHKELSSKLAELERKFEKHDTHIKDIFSAIRQLMRAPEESKRVVRGFGRNEEI